MQRTQLDSASVSHAISQDVRSHQASMAFALVDGALLQDLSISSQRKWRQLTVHSLLAKAAIGATEVGPLLFELTPAHIDSGFLQSLFVEKSGRLAGSFIVSKAEKADLVRTLSALVDVKLSDGSEMVMRYFDPRVLPFYLDVLEPGYRARLASVVSNWFFWDSAFKINCETFEPLELAQPEPSLPMTLSLDQESRLMNLTYPHTMIERFRSEDQGALDRIPVAQRYAFFQNQIARAKSHGLESQGDVEAYCGTAIDVGPRFDEDIAIGLAWLDVKAGKSFHEAIAHVTDVDWERMRGAR